MSKITEDFQVQIEEITLALKANHLNLLFGFLLFNDDSIMAISNQYPYFLFTHDETSSHKKYCALKLLSTGDYLENNSEFYPHLDLGLCAYLKDEINYPIITIVRQHPECKFIFFAFADNFRGQYTKKILKELETTISQFLDLFLNQIIAYKPSYRFSFILTNKTLRDAVIHQGYEQEINLTLREQECLWYSFHGMSAKEIARVLKISPFTVEDHLKKIRRQFNSASLNFIILECLHRGIIGKVSWFNQRRGGHLNGIQKIKISSYHAA